MRKVSRLATAAIVMAVVAGSAYADGSSMSRWTGDSYQAFAAAGSGTAAAAYPGRPGSNPDNGMSRWNGESYLVFETSRLAPATISVAEARATRVTPSRDVPLATAAGGRASTNPFRDNTGA